jgi:hypothetical protein
MAEQSTDFRCAQLSLARLDERMIESGSERHVPRSVDIHILPAQMYQYFVFMVDICHGLQNLLSEMGGGVKSLFPYFSVVLIDRIQDSWSQGRMKYSLME